MTTIIKSDVRLTKPVSGSLILPEIPISGIEHRWHAESAMGPLNGLATSISDSIGSEHLDTVSGVVRIKEVNKVRYIDLGDTAAGANVISRVLAQPKTHTAYTLAMLYYWDALPSASTSAFSASNVGSTPGGMNILVDKFGVGTWSTGGSSVGASSNNAPGWHTAMVTYNKNGNEMACVDGIANRGEASGGSTGTLDSVKSFGLRGSVGVNARVIDAMFINHAVTDAEIKTIHEALAAQIPK